MLRVTTLYACTAASTAQYYTRYLTDADGEQPGQWTGRQADLLGLSGEVATDQLQTLLEGRDPISGSPLGYPLLDRVTVSGKVVHAVAGFDATLSAPKSLSLWWALSGDEGLAECHDVAVRAVVGWVERYGSTTRIRRDGRRLHPDSQGLTAAVFRQTTSRLDDPQLHSHVVISAKVQTDDGRWLALDARSLKGYQRALGGLYQSVLRAELASRYGVVFGELVNGQAEIAGVHDALLERFSKRTAQVERAFQIKLAEFHTRERRDPTPKERGALGREAAEDTRGHKTGHRVADLRSRWLDEAADVGVTAKSIRDGIEQAAVARPSQRQRVVIEDVIDAVCQRRSAWHGFDVLQAICDTTRPQPGAGGEVWAAVLDRAIDVVLERCIDLDPSEVHTRRRVSRPPEMWPLRCHTRLGRCSSPRQTRSWART
jgi:conjugative relaxase-like TrwC/TraI family protein